MALMIKATKSWKTARGNETGVSWVALREEGRVEGSKQEQVELFLLLPSSFLFRP